jgi:hypothetical protein
LKYKWEDVWVLASIAMAGESEDPSACHTYKKKIILPEELSKFKNIYMVVSAGDYLNHAIFLVDELTTGIKNLLDGEFIEIENDFLKTTRKTDEYYENEIGDRKFIAIKTALTIFKKMLNVEQK